jgi:hypothetical protein
VAKYQILFYEATETNIGSSNNVYAVVPPTSVIPRLTVEPPPHIVPQSSGQKGQLHHG